jgi:hypothetical protein
VSEEDEELEDYDEDGDDSWEEDFDDDGDE